MFHSKVTSSFSHFTFFKGTRSLLEDTHSLLTPSERHRLVENSLILCCQAWKCSVLYLGDPLMSTMCYWRQQMHLHKREGKIYLRHCSGWSSGSRCKTVYWIPLDDLRVIRIYNVTTSSAIIGCFVGVRGNVHFINFNLFSFVLLFSTSRTNSLTRFLHNRDGYLSFTTQDLWQICWEG